MPVAGESVLKGRLVVVDGDVAAPMTMGQGGAKVSPLYGHSFEAVDLPEGIWVLPYGDSSAVEGVWGLWLCV